MTILRSGATEKYSQNWANAFGAKKDGRGTATVAPSKKKGATVKSEAKSAAAKAVSLKSGSGKSAAKSAAAKSAGSKSTSKTAQAKKKR